MKLFFFDPRALAAFGDIEEVAGNNFLFCIPILGVPVEQSAACELEDGEGGISIVVFFVRENDRIQMFLECSGCAEILVMGSIYLEESVLSFFDNQIGYFADFSVKNLKKR